MDKYNIFETYQYVIELAKLILTICQLQNDGKQDFMATVETYKQLYLLYRLSYQSNADYLEEIKVHFKVSESHNGVVGYHPVLAAVVIQEKKNITSDTSNKDQKIEANIKARQRYLIYTT